MKIIRKASAEYGTFGQWLDDSSKFLCYTLERPATGDHPCILAGTYTFSQFNSPHNGDVWLRDDKAANDGRSMIEIHPADLASQLLGCIAPGSVIGQLDGIPAVLNSQNTMKMLKASLPEKFILTIEWA